MSIRVWTVEAADPRIRCLQPPATQRERRVTIVVARVGAAMEGLRIQDEPVGKVDEESAESDLPR